MLNDGQLLQAYIPNCERLDKDFHTEYTATVAIKIGPTRARFQGRMEMLDFNPPHRFSSPRTGDEEHCSLIPPRPRSGALGSLMMQSMVKKLTQQFFSELGAIVASQQLSSPQ
jgi:carbon monoxide dehydrogenase subunit G